MARRILLVEDEITDIDLVKRAFERARSPYQITAVQTLNSAFTRLEKPDAYDAVVCDLFLPDGNGMDLLAHIRGKALPLVVVILTGSGGQRQVVSAIKAGADDYLVKSPDVFDQLPSLMPRLVEDFAEHTQRRHRLLRVLYAEHNSFDIDLIERHIDRYARHVQVDFVRNAAEVLTRLESTEGIADPYDVLLLDYRLSDVDALSLVKVLRRERQARIPIVFVTGQGNEEVAAQAMRLGVSDYVVKHDGYEFGLIATLENARHRAELEREHAALLLADARQKLFVKVFENARDAIVIADQKPAILAVNKAFTEITGYQEAEVLGQNPRVLKSGRHDLDFYKAMWDKLLSAGHWRGEVWNRRKDGEIYPEQLSITAVTGADGAPWRYIAIFDDMTDQRRTQAALEHLTHYDSLTALPNRRLFLANVDSAIRRAERGDGQLAVVILDLDRFKTINEGLGHAVGDAVLQAVGKRLSARLRGEDTIARLSADEFAVLLHDIESPDDVATVVRAMIERLQVPYAEEITGGTELFVGASVGIAIYPADGDTAEALMRNADSALLQSKQHQRGGYGFYREGLNDLAQQRLALEGRLRRALERDEFVVYYQPLVAVATGRIVGAEALVRWQPPGEPLVPPLSFIPLAEDNGLIVPLGLQVMRTACRQMKVWLDAGIALDSLSVNLSVRQFASSDLVADVAAALAETGCPPSALELELTESALMEQGDVAIKTLGDLKALGVRLAIDDFGTGYSSFAYLKRFRVDKLKIDRCFIKEIPDDAGDMEIAAAIVAMSRSLGLSVLAEGVETNAQLDFLRSGACDFYQGYLCSPPVPAAEFVRLLDACP